MQTYSNIAILSFFGLLTLLLIGSAIISFFENERLAGQKLIYATFASLLLTFVLSYFNYWAKPAVAVLLLGMVVITLYLFLKKPIKGFREPSRPQRDVDEAETIFARMKLKPNSTSFDNYYQNHPYLAKEDSKARKLPGLLSEKSLYYNPLTYSTANSNFQIIEYLHEANKHATSNEIKEIDSERLTRYLKNWTSHLGAHSIGVTELRNYHLYTKHGRGENIGKPVFNNHKYAIAFTVEMDAKNVQSAPSSSIVFESSQQYLNSANIALQISTFLKNLGYDSRAHIDGDYELICPLVARDAGLGEIGRMGLLMTPKLGPRVRIAVVTTDAPLVSDKYYADPTIVEFCQFCKKCAECCPSKSIPMDKMKEIKGVKRWQINSELCYQYWCISGTDCGRCISVCPFSHPNNILHNSIRHLIRRSIFVARFAFIADNWLYGRKPKPKALPKWMANKL
ncbi:MAG: reductive dehalogenase domain-containing protein [Perlabentimonas sp.]